jgi:hypothetical protein
MQNKKNKMLAASTDFNEKIILFAFCSLSHLKLITMPHLIDFDF